MKRIYLTVAAALALAACGPLTPPASIPAPVTIADRTTADEQLASSVEVAYSAWRFAVELGVDTGVFKGAAAATLAKVDRDVYAAVLVARSAYQTANATDFAAAVKAAKVTIARAVVTAKGLK